MLFGHQEDSLRFDADYYQVYRLANKHIKSCGNLIVSRVDFPNSKQLLPHAFVCFHTSHYMLAKPEDPP
jgi:hypothetical protein